MGLDLSQVINNEAASTIVAGFVWPQHCHAFQKGSETPVDHVAVGLMAAFTPALISWHSASAATASQASINRANIAGAFWSGRTTPDFTNKLPVPASLPLPM
jgi:hypothetical protein